ADPSHAPDWAVMSNRPTLVRKLVGSLVGLAGLMDIASALLPPIASRVNRVDRLVPLAVPHVANVAVVVSGVLLLFLGAQLVRGKRRAWQLAVVLVLTSVVLHVVKGLDFEEA